MKTQPWRTCTCTLADEWLSAGCPVHDHGADDSIPDQVFDYECLMVSNEGYKVETLTAVSTAHAFAEAEACFDGKCLAVKRGKFAFSSPWVWLPNKPVVAS